MENPYSINTWSTRKQCSNNLHSIADRFLLHDDLLCKYTGRTFLYSVLVLEEIFNPEHLI